MNTQPDSGTARPSDRAIADHIETLTDILNQDYAQDESVGIRFSAERAALTAAIEAMRATPHPKFAVGDRVVFSGLECVVEDTLRQVQVRYGMYVWYVPESKLTSWDVAVIRACIRRQ